MLQDALAHPWLGPYAILPQQVDSPTFPTSDVETGEDLNNHNLAMELLMTSHSLDSIDDFDAEDDDEAHSGIHAGDPEEDDMLDDYHLGSQFFLFLEDLVLILFFLFDRA